MQDSLEIHQPWSRREVSRVSIRRGELFVSVQAQCKRACMLLLSQENKNILCPPLIERTQLAGRRGGSIYRTGSRPNRLIESTCRSKKKKKKLSSFFFSVLSTLSRFLSLAYFDKNGRSSVLACMRRAASHTLPFLSLCLFQTSRHAVWAGNGLRTSTVHE